MRRSRERFLVSPLFPSDFNFEILQCPTDQSFPDEIVFFIVIRNGDGIIGLEGANLSMRRKMGQFIATDEKGRRYTILIYTNVIKAGTLENPSMEVEGKEELTTFEGMAVNRLEKGKYQIVQTGIIVKSDSPNAP